MKQLAVITLILLAIVAAVALSGVPGVPDTGPDPTATPSTGDPGFELLYGLNLADSKAQTAQANAAYLRGIATATGEARAAQTAQAIAQATQQAQSLTQAVQSTRDSAATSEAWTITGWTATADVANSTATARAQATATSQAMVVAGLTVTADAANSTATARAQATTDAFVAGSLARAEQREIMVNNLVALMPYLVGAIIVAVIIWVLLLLVPVLQERMRDRQPDKQGRYPLLVNHRGMVFLADRAPSSLVDTDTGRVILDIDPAMQERITARSQAVEVARTTASGQSAPRITVEPAPAAQIAAQPAVLALPEIAPWSILSTWPGGKLPLGIGEQGVIALDPETAAPHLLFAGTTGSGKTRYGLRPVIAEALGDGWQVIILDRSGVDLSVFADHPNAHMIQVDEPVQVIAILKRAYTELIARLRELTPLGATTLSRSTSTTPRVMIVIDEFSNLADDTKDAGEREELWRRTRMLAAEGRKAGMVLALALQDPTHKSMDLRIRRNCTRVAFRVQDADASRVILGASGAEQLPPHRFMTVLGSLVTGVAFAPSDDEIRAFLAARQVPMLPAPIWLDEPVEQGDSRDEQIRALHAGGASLNEIQRQVFGFTGGAAYDAVKAILASTTGTTTGSTGTDTSSWATQGQ